MARVAPMLMPVPMCAVCGEKVDEMTQTQDCCTGDTYITVKCHGAVESVNVSRLIGTPSLQPPHMSVGLAFQQKALDRKRDGPPIRLKVLELDEKNKTVTLGTED